ncbi:hypothetical protein FSP39_002841 [Pinctada imbricata]|uniref:DNA-directed DNA polymerase n=1 Tax=Pinctada imbricata TaxID=66713 RepID=A0AA88YH74_PINIB|nr:hypothetical protein FSP39_002841 [Pinctada imbricata]
MEKAKHKGSPIQIQHALNQGEFKVPGTNYRCDGYDRTNNTIYEYYAENLFKTLTDPRKEIYDFHIVAKDILQLEYYDDPLFLPNDIKTNIFLASFTTMWARLRLYEILDVLDRDVLYYDTDSVIFRCDGSSTLEKLPIGNFLGELTNEVDSQDHIVLFCSGGPKNYAYRTNLGKEECKVRGFTLNWKNANLINMKSVRSMILGTGLKEIIVTNPCKISRHAKKRKLYNRVEHKKYKLVYTKRRILENLDTLPFGY